ncbi:MAG: hypothetical protein ACO27N_00985, partial [Bacteroidia bacterium]
RDNLGTYLSYNFKSLLYSNNVDLFKRAILNENDDLKKDDDFYIIDNPGVKILNFDNGNDTNNIKFRLSPPGFGLSKELVGSLVINNNINLPETDNKVKAMLPFVEFGIDTDKNKLFFSLFGSQFYYNQTELGRAFLFLHSIPWTGVVGDVNARDNSTPDGNTYEVSLFDTSIESGGKTEKLGFKSSDDSFTLKSLKFFALRFYECLECHI